MIKILIFIFLVTQIGECSIRAAIDIGSGGPKLRVAEIDASTHKITKTLFVKEYPVIFQNCLSKNSDRRLSKEIMAQGIAALQESRTAAMAHGAEQIVCLGASVFRNAVNSAEFIQEIHAHTGLHVQVLDQELEAVLAFDSVLSKTDIQAEHLIVWDIGGGSTQFIRKTLNERYEIHASEEGSGYFRDFIIEHIQSKEIETCKSPNPLSIEDALQAETQAIVQAHKAAYFFSRETHIIGVGSVFARGIHPLVAKKNPFTLAELEIATRQLVGKTDADLGGGDFACIEVSNPLLVLGFLRGLGFNEMSIMDTNIAEGALVHEPFWRASL